MYLLILLPFLIVTTLAGIISIMFENPDKVLDDHYSYFDIEENIK